MQRLIIDTDPGVDDAHAIMMAYAYPGARVEALLTVAGNVGLYRTTANACTILDMLGANTPVYAGCSSALVMPPPENAAAVHGSDGLGGVNFPPSTRRVEREHAAHALVRMVSSEPGVYTLVSIGPMTNLAVALKLDPDLPAKLKNYVSMSGAIMSRGNTRNPSAEFNAFADPEAAHVVFEAWHDFSLVSWETTVSHGFSTAILEKWFSIDSRRAQFFRQINQHVLDYTSSHLGERVLYGADALAMAVALEPTIVTRAEQHAVQVELAGSHTRGQTIIDWHGRTGKPKNCRVVMEVNHSRFLALMEQALR